MEKIIIKTKVSSATLLCKNKNYVQPNKGEVRILDGRAETGEIRHLPQIK
jgi:hypothetical protein